MGNHYDPDEERAFTKPVDYTTYPPKMMNNAQTLKFPPEASTREFTTGATRDADDSKLDYEGFLSPEVLKIFAEYMHKCRLRNIPSGATIRSSDNWQKGIPREAYIKSLIRHTMEAWSDHRDHDAIDRDTLCAIMFNAMGYLFEQVHDR